MDMTLLEHQSYYPNIEFKGRSCAQQNRMICLIATLVCRK